MSVDWARFERDGFVVIPDFLDAEAADELLAMYADAPLAETANYAVSRLSYEAKRQFETIAVDAVKGAATMGTPVDRLSHAAFFATERVSHGWHQDHECQYMFQTYNYINIWIPIRKPSAETSNVTLVPFGKLREKNARAWEFLRFGAGRNMHCTGDRSYVRDYETGGNVTLDINLEQVAESPSLAKGDALVMRGDIMHRTQDAFSDRVAISFRLVDSRPTISRTALCSGGFHKWLWMINNFWTYERILGCFETVGSETVTVAAVLDHLDDPDTAVSSFPLLQRALGMQVGAWMQSKQIDLRGLSSKLCGCAVCKDLSVSILRGGGWMES